MRSRAGMGEAVAVWSLYGLELAATLVTYARLQPESLYNVDRGGDLLAGLSRALTVLNFPLALGAIALAGLAARPRWLVWASIPLCALVVVPGVLDQDDLDARPVNVLPGLGALLALGLTVAAVRRDGASFVRRAEGDRLRLALGVLLLLVALPWLTAEWGFHFPGDVFLGEERHPVRDPKLDAVHFGFHHGHGGVLLAATALLLSRAPAGRVLRAYLSLMLAYGLTLAVQDAWNEQLWKRGTVDWMIPDPVRPDLSWVWLVIVTGGAAVYALWFRPARPR
jgi:hypothetical protein